MDRGGRHRPVREVHNWSTRPFWPQGMTSLPDGDGSRAGGPRLGPLARARAAPALSPGLHERGLPRLVRLRHGRPRRHGALQLLPDLQDPEARLAPERRSEPEPVLEDRRPALEEAGEHRLLPASLAHPLGVPGAAGAASRRAPLVRRRPASARSRASSTRTASPCPRRGCCWWATPGRSSPSSTAGTPG